MRRVAFCGFMVNVCDPVSYIRLRRLTAAARHRSGIGKEHSLVGATSVYRDEFYPYQRLDQLGHHQGSHGAT